MLPISFFAVGATLAENAAEGELRLPPPLTRPVALAVLVRLVLAPGLLIALSSQLIDLPAAYLLIASMPTGVTAMIVAHTYGLDMEITVEAVAWSTAIVVAGAARLASALSDAYNFPMPGTSGRTPTPRRRARSARPSRCSPRARPMPPSTAARP